MIEKRNSLTNVPVYINFFNRPDTLKKVFEAVQKARPCFLYLSCDGAREGNSADLEKISQCQRIVSNIDWECEVIRDYSDKNLGCGMRMFSGISSAFKYVDRLIILEDDCVPNQSFFTFCEEVLERYKDDQRINMISGMNHLGAYENTKYSYLFAKTGSCWGWATWTRAWDNVEYDMPFMVEPETLKLLSKAVTPKGYGDYLINLGKSRYHDYLAGNKLSAWTFQHGMSIHLNSQLIIVPRENLITNVGLAADSTHAVNSIKKLPKATQGLFNMETYDINLPLKHPRYIIENVDYAEKVGKIMGGHRFFRKIEGYARQIIFAEKGDFSKLWRKLLIKLHIMKSK